MTGILPTYQRFVNGVPVPSISRRAFRLREKYLIVSVLLTFAIVWLGALFYLPEFKSSSVNDSVYNVYKRIQKAGPELLMPPPLQQNDVGEFPVVGMVHHGHGVDGDDPHVVEDRHRLRAKIDEDMSMKVLERPEFEVRPSMSSSRASSKAPNAIEEPAKAASKFVSPSGPKAAGSEVKYVGVALGPDADPEVKRKQETVKEVSLFNSLLTQHNYCNCSNTVPVGHRCH